MSTAIQALEPAIDAKARKLARRSARTLRKHEEDARRRLDAWERYHALWDAIDLKRKIVDMCDTKAKLALTIMGALNATVFLLLFRSTGIVSIPAGMRPWLAGVLVVYGAVTFGFIVHAIEALRPRIDSRTHALDDIDVLEAERSHADDTRGRSYFFALDATPPGLTEDLRRWRDASASEVNAELVVMNRGANEAVLRQLAALERVYRGLKALLVLAAVILCVAGAAWAFKTGG